MFYFAKYCRKIYLWSAVIGQSANVYKHRMKRRRCCLHVAFESLFPMWKFLLTKEKFWNYYFEIEFWNKFLMWKGPKGGPVGATSSTVRGHGPSLPFSPPTRFLLSVIGPLCGLENYWLIICRYYVKNSILEQMTDRLFPVTGPLQSHLTAPITAQIWGARTAPAH